MERSLDIPEGAEITVISRRIAVQSRADETEAWRVENDTTNATSKDAVACARRLERIYQTQVDPNRETRLVRRTHAVFDEVLEG
jgi:hypothetical protein